MTIILPTKSGTVHETMFRLIYHFPLINDIFFYQNSNFDEIF